MNVGYIYNYQDYEDIIRSGFSDLSKVHSTDAPLDNRGYYTGIGMKLCKTNDGKYYFVSDLSKVPYHKVRELAKPRHIHDILLLQALCNKYIPVYDTNNNLLFTIEDFNNLRRKMSGLTEYDADDFIESPNLDLPNLQEIIDKSISEKPTIDAINNAILEKTKKVIEQRMGLALDSADKSSSYRVINTGSTGRGTNVAGDMDFDYAVVMDLGQFVKTFSDKLFVNVDKLQKVLESEFVIGPGYIGRVSTARLRLKSIPVTYNDTEGKSNDGEFDIDFSFFSNAKEYFSTVDSLEQRLDSIRRKDEELYKKVVANIIYAKMLLKGAGAYKPSRSDKSQGGLGGVGIENWILQNGGSFIDAAQGFCTVAKKYIELYNVDLNDLNNYNDDDKFGPAFKAFIAFQAEYPIFDFGKSIESVSKGNFPYDNFVMRNMRISGFLKTYKCLDAHLELLKQNGYIMDENSKII